MAMWLHLRSLLVRVRELKYPIRITEILYIYGMPLEPLRARDLQNGSLGSFFYTQIYFILYITNFINGVKSNSGQIERVSDKYEDYEEE